MKQRLRELLLTAFPRWRRWRASESPHFHAWLIEVVRGAARSEMPIYISSPIPVYPCELSAVKPPDRVRLPVFPTFRGSSPAGRNEGHSFSSWETLGMASGRPACATCSWRRSAQAVPHRQRIVPNCSGYRRGAPFGGAPFDRILVSCIRLDPYQILEASERGALYPYERNGGIW